MGKIVVGVALRDRLGEAGARELSDYIEQQGDVWRADAVNTCTDRFNTRLQNYAGKSEVLDGFNKVIDRLADTKIELADRMSATKIELGDRLSEMRVELLRWSFAFWIGQVAVMAGAMALMFRLFNT